MKVKVIFVLLLLILSFAAYQRNLAWLDNLILWRSAIERNPQPDDTRGNIKKAIAEFQRDLRLGKDVSKYRSHYMHGTPVKKDE